MQNHRPSPLMTIIFKNLGFRVEMIEIRIEGSTDCTEKVKRHTIQSATDKKNNQFTWTVEI